MNRRCVFFFRRSLRRHWSADIHLHRVVPFTSGPWQLGIWMTVWLNGLVSVFFHIPKRRKSWSTGTFFGFFCIRDVSEMWMSCRKLSCFVFTVVQWWGFEQLALPLAPAQAGKNIAHAYVTFLERFLKCLYISWISLTYNCLLNLI